MCASYTEIKYLRGDSFRKLIASVFAAMSDNFSVANYVTAYTRQLPRLLNCTSIQVYTGAKMNVHIQGDPAKVRPTYIFYSNI